MKLAPQKLNWRLRTVMYVAGFMGYKRAVFISMFPGTNKDMIATWGLQGGDIPELLRGLASKLEKK